MVMYKVEAIVKGKRFGVLDVCNENEVIGAITHWCKQTKRLTPHDELTFTVTRLPDA